MTQLRRIFCLAIFVIPLLLLPHRAAAQSATVTDDAFASTNATTQALNLNGQGIVLIVAGSSAMAGSPQVSVGLTKSYIKFQLMSSLPPGTTAANVTKATLKLYLSPLTKPSGTIDIYPLTSAWTESTLNPSSPPALASMAFATQIPVSQANSFLVVDVTKLVQEWLMGSANGGLDNDGIALVADTGTTYVVFDSKESIVTSHEPRLEIVLANSGPQGAAGPQGPQGATGATGPAGAAATVSVGATTTVLSGTNAMVTNAGSSSAALLNFLIPQGIQGPQGTPGIPGIPGPIGQTGAAGAAGPAGTNGLGFNFRKAFDSAAAYALNDVVSYNGSSYAALTATKPGDSTPDLNPAWSLAAQQGAAGTQGLQGVQGPKGDQGLQGIQGLQGSQGTKGDQGLPGIPGLQGPLGPAGPQGPAGPAGTGSGSSSSSLLSAFLPGPLTQAYTAASFVADSPITVTRISANLKTAPDPSCQPMVLRVSDGASGQDVRILGGKAGKDTGAMSLKFGTGADLKVQVQTPANCSAGNPADANVVVQYRSQQSSDSETCAQSGLACNGICEETQSDLSNCGACGNVCPSIANGAPACSSGACTGACNYGFSTCGGFPANGCNFDLLVDSRNCGGCGNVCFTPANGSTYCSNGRCFPQCPQGYGLCGSTCLNFYGDPYNCGGCGGVCPSVTYVCGTHSCGLGTCDTYCTRAGSCSNYQCQ
jgi:hypothetical protein